MGQRSSLWPKKVLKIMDFIFLDTLTQYLIKYYQFYCGIHLKFSIIYLYNIFIYN